MRGTPPLTFFDPTSSQNAPERTHCPHICRERAWAQTFNSYSSVEATFVNHGQTQEHAQCTRTRSPAAINLTEIIAEPVLREEKIERQQFA